MILISWRRGVGEKACSFHCTRGCRSYLFLRELISFFFMVLEGNFFKASVEVQDPQTHASSPLAAWQAPAQHHTHPARDRFSHDRWTLTAGIFFPRSFSPHDHMYRSNFLCIFNSDPVNYYLTYLKPLGHRGRFSHVEKNTLGFLICGLNDNFMATCILVVTIWVVKNSS